MSRCTDCGADMDKFEAQDYERCRDCRRKTGKHGSIRRCVPHDMRDHTTKATKHLECQDDGALPPAAQIFLDAVNDLPIRDDDE